MEGVNTTVSVVIAVYNGERYLAQAIESALAQSFPPSEIIVIDDGSKDGTPGVINAYQKKGAVISRRVESNAGVANAMNLGMSLAAGDWIAFLDHDDIWFKNKLRRQLEEAHRAPSAGFVCCNYALRPNGLKRRLVPHYSRLDVLRVIQDSGPLIAEPIPVLLHENIVGTSSSAMVRMDVAKRVGEFNRGYRVSGDYDFWLRCAALAPFVAVPEMLFYKRTHVTNISSNEVLTLEEQRRIVYEFTHRFAGELERGHWTRLAAFELAAMDYRLGSLCFESGKPREAFRHYVRAWRTLPNASNTARFLWTSFKKTMRLMSGDLLSRKRWQR